MILNISPKSGIVENDILEIKKTISEQSLNPELIILFISESFDLKKVEEELFSAELLNKVIACTTSGEIGQNGLNSSSLVAQVFFEDEFKSKTYCLDNLSSGFKEDDFADLTDELSELESRLNGEVNSFGILLVDGLSEKEEDVCSFLSQKLYDFPIIGGSAGDNLNFEKTYILTSSGFKNDCATLTLLSTTRDIKLFKAQHFTESKDKMIITSASPETRTVYEINGEPAALHYANLLNLKISELTPEVFSDNPLMLNMGGDSYIRSIQKVGENDSLVFYCAIDDGLPLLLADHSNLADSNKNVKALINESIGEIDSCLLFECILRKLEILNLPDDEKKKINSFYSDLNAIGFYTYGEQFQNTHINQTITGVAFGKK